MMMTINKAKECHLIHSWQRNCRKEYKKKKTEKNAKKVKIKKPGSLCLPFSSFKYTHTLPPSLPLNPVKIQFMIN